MFGMSEEPTRSMAQTEQVGKFMRGQICKVRQVRDRHQWMFVHYYPFLIYLYIVDMDEIYNFELLVYMFKGIEELPIGLMKRKEIIHYDISML